MNRIRNITIGFSLVLIFAVVLAVGFHYFSESDIGKSVFSEKEAEIVRYIMPSDVIEAQPQEKITLNVIALSDAEITVKLGTQKFKAVCEKDAVGFAAFRADITMPKSEMEVDSLGRITVIANYGGESVQLEGPKIVSQKNSSLPLAPTAPDANYFSTTFDIKNYISEVQNDLYGSGGIANKATSSDNSENSSAVAFTGNQMCIVKDYFADTKPIASDDDYAPFYAPLPEGTIDFVTGESQGYNEEENEPIYYYNLQSGRTVKKESVQLVQRQDLGDNSLNVLSSVTENGKLKITLSTKWKVPFDITYSGQDYYYSGDKKYNVAAFTASGVEISFHYTPTVSGVIDVSGSEVVSAAYWRMNEGTGTVKLVLELKNPGEWYGCGVEYDQNGNMLITVNRKPTGAAGAVVVLDPGHGGRDPGAMGLQNQVRESHVNLLVAFETMRELQSRGVTVYLTQSDDSEVELIERKAATRKIKPDLFLSIHSNASTNTQSIGASAYYFKPFSFELANNVYNKVLSVHRNYFYAGQSGLYNEVADGVHYYPFSVTRIEECPSALLELGFLTNDNECYMLADSNNHKLLGKAIADAIVETLS